MQDITISILLLYSALNYLPHSNLSGGNLRERNLLSSFLKAGSNLLHHFFTLLVQNNSKTENLFDKVYRLVCSFKHETIMVFVSPGIPGFGQLGGSKKVLPRPVYLVGPVNQNI